MDAWKQAIMHTQQTAKRGYTHESSSLQVVMQAYLTWSGSTSSGVEQTFSIFTQLNQSQRAGHTSAIMERNELKVARDMCDLDDSETNQIVTRAQEIWREHFGAPRKGFKRASMAANFGEKDQHSERTWFAIRRRSVQAAS